MSVYPLGPLELEGFKLGQEPLPLFSQLGAAAGVLPDLGIGEECINFFDSRLDALNSRFELVGLQSGEGVDAEAARGRGLALLCIFRGAAGSFRFITAASFLGLRGLTLSLTGGVLLDLIGVVPEEDLDAALPIQHQQVVARGVDESAVVADENEDTLEARLR